MRLAWQSAQPLQPDYFLWLNDDTVLRPRAIADLLALYRASPTAKTICVGCTTDPITGIITYGGYKRVEGSLSRLRYRHLQKRETDCDTMNGNCVLFPACAVTDIGINGAEYSHAFGDIDYGLRAKRAGYIITQLAEPVAHQERNEKYLASTSTLTFKNWRFILTHPKGVPLREWFVFCRRYGGILWPINFIYRYIKMLRFP
jgi:GT2 family glycosyltransferase